MFRRRVPLVYLSVVFVLLCAGRVSGWEQLFTNSWVVEVDGGREVADAVAKRHGFVNLGQVGGLEGTYHFVHTSSPARSRRGLTAKHLSLMADTQVILSEQQIAKKRVKRDYSSPSDAMWSKQWYLHRSSHHDMNVERAWEQGVTGKGVVISILDDGIEHTHPDLVDNYDPLASYDFNSHDSDPFPRYDVTNENKHGTRCAGEVAANNDGKCGTGAAYAASIGGVRMLDGQVTDVVESSSLYLNPQHIDIYSSSWGPSDNGQTVDGPGRLAKKAFRDGITKGRHGLGSIYVWAAGNGGRDGDSCNCDGYAVSPYTISIGSVSENDKFPWYAELCSSTISSTYSSGSGSEKQIVSTDLHHKCTDRHTGTSASAPLAAGILALALETNRNLTWRDMQYLVVYSSNSHLPRDGDWTVNGAGLKVSHKYGFGVLDGSAIVNRARWWINVPPQVNCSISVDVHRTRHATNSNPLVVTIDTTSCSVTYLEHAQAIITLELKKGKRKDIEIILQSPASVSSILLPYRKRDYHSDGFHSWPFMTVHNWGEDPRGRWKLTIKVGSSSAEAALRSLRFVLLGTKETPRSVRNVPLECDPECEGGCAGAGPQYCDTCKNFQLANTFECVETCPVGTYVDHHMCRSCPSLCAHCDKDSCITCVQGAVKLSDGACSNTCEPFTFLSLNGSCLPCHHSCVECFGPEENSCTVCPQQFVLEEGSCKVPASCQSGEYFDGRSLECRLCHETCAECVGKGAQECTACFPGFGLEDGVCSAEHTDSRKCSTGEYYDGVEERCVACPAGCAKCTDNITCTSCDPGHFLRMERIGESQVEVTSCVTECPKGFHGDTDSLSCQPCPSDCETCTSHDMCTSCTLNYTTPINGQCPQPCHAGQYFDFETSHCLQCLEHCQACRNGQTCLTCLDGFFLMADSHCLDACPKHLVVDEENQRCVSKSCHSSCQTCFGEEPDQCLSCPGSSKLFEHSCMEECPPHTFYDEPTASCLHCHESCLSCAGPSESNCLQCPEGKLMSHFTCVSECPEGSFVLDGDCVSCPLNCLQCSSTDRCSVCEDTHLLQASQCVEQCSDGYFTKGSVCEPCPPGCRSCSQHNLCQSCEEGFLYYIPNRSCVRSCPDGYFTSRGTCSACPRNCSKCTGPSKDECSLCSHGSAMNTTSHTCTPCCNKDFPDRVPCCDCDRDDAVCTALTSPGAGGKASQPSHTAGLVVTVFLIVLLAAAMVGIGGYYVVTRVRRRVSGKYKPVPNGELLATLALVEDSESGSEAELFAKEDA